MSFLGIHDKVVYIVVSIHINVGAYMYSVHFACAVLDYNTVTWWRCDDDMITNFPGYPYNVYDDLSHENEQKEGWDFYEWIRYIFFNVIHVIYILTSRTYSFCTG